MLALTLLALSAMFLPLVASRRRATAPVVAVSARLRNRKSR